MIVFDLICSSEHIFEVWFSDSQSFEEQVASGDVSCPICGDTNVKKAPMAPNISTSKQRRDSLSTVIDGDKNKTTPGGTAAQVPDPENVAQAMQVLRQMQDYVQKNFDHVGKEFTEEVRKIHYGESDHRNVYGDATPEEADELREEGIEVSQMPWLPRHNS